MDNVFYQHIQEYVYCQIWNVSGNQLLLYLPIIHKPFMEKLNNIKTHIADLETSIVETEDLIAVLDNDVTELDVLVTTLQEENIQLQQTVNLLLQRVAALEATDTATNNTLDGTI